MAKKAEITKKNGVLVICARDGKGGLDSDIVEAGPYFCYSAITQMWADGLGKWNS